MVETGSAIICSAITDVRAVGRCRRDHIASYAACLGNGKRNDEGRHRDEWEDLFHKGPSVLVNGHSA
jgi:hypothetical protein